MKREERKIQREIDFTDWWLREHKMEGAPTYADAIAWADEHPCMNEDFVPFELLCKLRNKGYYRKQARYEGHIHDVLKWLREEKKIHIGFGYSPRKKWRYVVMYMDDRFYNKPTFAVDGFLEIEQAALVGIEYTLDKLI